MGAGDLSEEPAPGVSVGTVFDRFPASVRGAVVVKAQDREPHQIRLLAVRVTRAHDQAKEVHRAAVEETTVDVAPHKEVLIPFDVPFTELGPGWFCVVADIEVDGSRHMTGPEGGGRPFGVPWPADEVRRLDLKNLKLGGVVIERIRSRPDRTEIRWRPPKGAEDAELKLSAGKQRLPVVETIDDPRTGTRTTVTHPLPKDAAQLTVESVASGRGRSVTTVDLG